MREPTLPRNRDQDLPTRRGEEMGEREPLTPKPSPGEEQSAPRPEEDTFEREDGEKPPLEKPPVED